MSLSAPPFSVSTCRADQLKGVAACNEHTPARATALLFLGTTFIGYTDGVAIIITTIEIPDQDDIGIATGVMGALRSVMGSICTAVYTAVLQNRLAETVAAQVPQAVIGAGLPSQSVQSFLQALTSGSKQALDTVKGLTPQILEIGEAVYKHAAADAFRTVFLTSIAFGGVGIILSFFTPNVDHRMTNEVAAILNQGLHDRQQPKYEEVV